MMSTTPCNIYITTSARDRDNYVIKYNTMKTVLTSIIWFTATFVAVSVLTSALAAEPVRQPLMPPADCSCGVCEESR